MYKATHCCCEIIGAQEELKWNEMKGKDTEMPLPFCSTDLIKLSKLKTKWRFISVSSER